MRFHILLFLSLVLAFAACEKDSTTEVVTFTQSTLSGETVTANFFGQLTNDQDEVVANAEVRIGDKQTTTDQEGLWSVNNATVVKDQAFIQFAAERHHRGSRTLLVEQSGTYEVDVEMLQFTGTTTIDAATGGVVGPTPTNIGIEPLVTFPPNAFSNADGTPYTGTVRVEAAYLDPNELSTANRMPGDLRAITAEGNSRLLITYGMVSVEIFDDAGNEVQLADGITATISLPVTGEAANTAPATIPLWFFDESTAQWVEEGTASLQNGSYVGEVSHFTFWNCDIPTEYVRLCGTVVFEGVDSTTAANLMLIIESTNFGRGYGYTDQNGQFCGIVPANETLTFIIQGDCNQPIYTVTIGPYTSDTDLGTIIVPVSQNSLITVSGTASCNGATLTSGAVRIYQSGSQITATVVEPDGTFTTNFVSCDTSDITVRVINYATLEESDDQVFAFSNNIMTGDIAACAQTLDNFFELIINGNTPQLGDSIYFGQDNNFTFMQAVGFTANETFDFSFESNNIIPNPPATGTYMHSPGVDGTRMTVRSSNFPDGSVIFSAFDFTITQVATPTDPFIEGQIGPFVETVTDSMGVDTDYTIQINFSAPAF